MRFYLFLIITPFIFLTSCSEKTEPQIGGNQAAHESRWEVRAINATEASAMMAKNPDVRVLDVRTPAEFAEGHIKGAINVDFKAADFADQLAKVDQQKTYILHCRSGGRSSKALSVLKKGHFGTIYHLDKGFNDWQSARLPIEK